MENKRGQGLSTNAIILIILGLAILVLLILGFTMGWSTLAPWLSSNNVDDLVTQCDIACKTNSQYNFCTKNVTLKADDLEDDVIASCAKLAADYEDTYGIKPCPGLC